MTNDKMPELLHVAVNVDENVPCDFVAHETQIFTYMSQPYIRADLCPKPEKIEGLEEALETPIIGCRDLTADDEKNINTLYKAARAYLKLTEE
jgi:hypothetical protein